MQRLADTPDLRKPLEAVGLTLASSIEINPSCTDSDNDSVIDAMSEDGESTTCAMLRLLKDPNTKWRDIMKQQGTPNSFKGATNEMMQLMHWLHLHNALPSHAYSKRILTKPIHVAAHCISCHWANPWPSVSIQASCMLCLQRSAILILSSRLTLCKGCRILAISLVQALMRLVKCRRPASILRLGMRPALDPFYTTQRKKPAAIKITAVRESNGRPSTPNRSRRRP